MPKPPVFDRYTHERQKDLLAAEEKRLQSKGDWKVVGHFALIVVLAVVVVGSLISLVVKPFLR